VILWFDRYVSAPLLRYRIHAVNTISEGALKVKVEWAAVAAFHLSRVRRAAPAVRVPRRSHRGPAKGRPHAAGGGAQHPPGSQSGGRRRDQRAPNASVASCACWSAPFDKLREAFEAVPPRLRTRSLRRDRGSTKSCAKEQLTD
jgi:hypothetical protein